MKLSPLLSFAKGVLDDVLKLPKTHCDLGENCLDKKITDILNAALERVKNGVKDGNVHTYQQREIEFLISVSIVQTDGRSCPGWERYEQLEKLTNNKWRHDLSVVTTGLHYGQIKLSSDDLVRLSPTEE